MDELERLHAESHPSPAAEPEEAARHKNDTHSPAALVLTTHDDLPLPDEPVHTEGTAAPLPAPVSPATDGAFSFPEARHPHRPCISLSDSCPCRSQALPCVPSEGQPCSKCVVPALHLFLHAETKLFVEGQCQDLKLVWPQPAAWPTAGPGARPRLPHGAP